MFNRRKKKEQKFKIGVSKPRNRFFSFEGKTIWDIFQLLIIPLVLALIAIFFNQAENRRSESIETERVNQNILDNYFGEMTSLLLEKNLRESPQNSEERSVARVLTLSALRALDGSRKGFLLKFLHESELIGGIFITDGNLGRIDPVIYLVNADFSKAHLGDAFLRGAYLWGVNLQGANLEGADLWYADLNEVNLSEANLISVGLRYVYMTAADLSSANLSRADLIDATLTGTDLTDADLSDANLTNANLPQAILRGTKLIGVELSGADLSGVFLSGADLREANLYGADLRWAHLNDAILTNAYLTDAKNITNEQLAEAKTLHGATLPNGEIYDPEIHTELADLRRQAGREP